MSSSTKLSSLFFSFFLFFLPLYRLVFLTSDCASSRCSCSVQEQSACRGLKALMRGTIGGRSRGFLISSTATFPAQWSPPFPTVRNYLRMLLPSYVRLPITVWMTQMMGRGNWQGAKITTEVPSNGVFECHFVPLTVLSLSLFLELGER